MGYLQNSSDRNIAVEFYDYCVKYGYTSNNCERLTTENAYQMLYVCWINRTKEKRYNYDAFLFEQNAGAELEKKAEQVAKLTWRPGGYKAFQVYHPTRTINAPLYSDRIVEQWLTERYIIPFWEKKILPNNMACQKDKGPHKAMEIIRDALTRCYEKYGLNFWFFQGDMQGYYDNISQAYVKRIFEGMDPYGYFLFCNIVDSWEETECYAKQNNPDGKYGFPKGNLPSQWVGITTLNELDHLIDEREDCLFLIRYMDDFLCFFPTKKSCIDCKSFTEYYLEKNELGVRLHPRKTAYAPITRGFNFCGWHYKLREDGSIEVKLKQDKKTLKKKEMKAKQKAYETGRISWDNVTDSVQSTFAHYKHGDTKKLRKYMCNRYHFKTKYNSNYQRRR